MVSDGGCHLFRHMDFDGVCRYRAARAVLDGIPQVGGERGEIGIARAVAHIPPFLTVSPSLHNVTIHPFLVSTFPRFHVSPISRFTDFTINRFHD